MTILTIPHKNFTFTFEIEKTHDASPFQELLTEKEYTPLNGRSHYETINVLKELGHGNYYIDKDYDIYFYVATYRDDWYYHYGNLEDLLKERQDSNQNKTLSKMLDEIRDVISSTVERLQDFLNDDWAYFNLQVKEIVEQHTELTPHNTVLPYSTNHNVENLASITFEYHYGETGNTPLIKDALDIVLDELPTDDIDLQYLAEEIDRSEF